MGMFDSIYATCPECGNAVEFQSKAGICALGDYNIDTAPIAVLADCIGKLEICEQCGATVRINGRIVAWVETWRKS